MTSFKGSDGWYDSFKKRHRISLTSMTGVSSLAEEDMDDIMVEMGELLKVLGDEDEDDEVEEEEVVVEEAQEPAAGNNQEQVVQAVLGQANPGPLEVNAAVNDEEEEEYDLPAIYEEPTTLPSLLLRSCSIYIPDPEVVPCPAAIPSPRSPTTSASYATAFSVEILVCFLTWSSYSNSSSRYTSPLNII